MDNIGVWYGKQGSRTIDLCLQFNGEKPKKVLKKIARMLSEDGMDNVKLITTAKVPIVKFIDSQSKIPVDISINNSLAAHNTELLRRYSSMDSRVKPFIISIKYWARNRGISDAAMGTFSSYAWTLIALNYLQSLEKEVLPNVLKRDGSKTVDIDGTKYDIAMYSDNELDFTTQNQSTTGELVSGFFESLAKDWPWNNGVISVGSAKILTRKEKNWVATKPYISDAIQDSEIKRLGKFSLPVEDPFDNKHDLSRVLDVEGVFEKKLFTTLDGQEAQSLNDSLSKQGFRRSQNIIYRPNCQNCTQCQSVRILVENYSFSIFI